MKKKEEKKRKESSFITNKNETKISGRHKKKQNKNRFLDKIVQIKIMIYDI